MAFSALQIWDVRTTGSDANGGGFNPNNSNFPTDGTVDTNTGNTSAPVFSSASYNFVAGDVGAWLFIKSGTNSFPGWYQIASVASNKATLTAGLGTAYLSCGFTPVYLNDTAGFKALVLNSGTAAAGIASVGTPTSLTWGIDFSQQDAAEITYTDMVISGGTNTIFSSAANPVNKRLVGNIINVTSGTGFTVQRVEVVSTSGTNATCDKSLGTLSSTGGNGAMGGALATPGQVGALKIAGTKTFIKSGTYTLSSASSNVSGGTVSDTTGGAADYEPDYWIGWDTVRHVNNTDSTHATISVPNTSTYNNVAVFSFPASRISVLNLDIFFQGSTPTTTVGYSSYTNGSNKYLRNCTVTGATSYGFRTDNTMLISCIATGCSGTSAIKVGDGTNTGIGFAYCCEAYANTCRGFEFLGAGRLLYCLSYGNTGTTVGFYGTLGSILHGCVAYGNGSHGFSMDGNSNGAGGLTTNCIAEGNGGAGFWSTIANGAALLMNCAAYNNTSGNLSTNFFMRVLNFVHNTTGSFFTNAAGHDFSLNNTTNQGALLRATGFPGVFPRGTTTAYLDIGAAQHADPAAGGGLLRPFGMQGGLI